MKVPILYYHSIGETELSVNPIMFRRQMRYLKGRGYRTLRVSEVAADIAGASLPEKAVAITFDDCFEDVYWNAVPILEDLGFTATCFAAVDYLGTTLWGIPAAQRWRLERQQGDVPFPVMSWEQIYDLKRRGFEIGAHTLSHRNLTDLPSQEARSEISESKRMLEERLGTHVDSFAYPRGRCNQELVEMVRDSGYRAACTNLFGYAGEGCDPWTLPRVPGATLMTDFVTRIEKMEPWGVLATIVGTCVVRGLRLIERAVWAAQAKQRSWRDGRSHR